MGERYILYKYYIYIRIYNIYACMHGDRQRYDTCVFKNGGWAPQFLAMSVGKIEESNHGTMGDHCHWLGVKDFLQENG